MSKLKRIISKSIIKLLVVLSILFICYLAYIGEPTAGVILIVMIVGFPVAWACDNLNKDES